MKGRRGGGEGEGRRGGREGEGGGEGKGEGKGRRRRGEGEENVNYNHSFIIVKYNKPLGLCVVQVLKLSHQMIRFVQKVQTVSNNKKEKWLLNYS